MCNMLSLNRSFATGKKVQSYEEGLEIKVVGGGGVPGLLFLHLKFREEVLPDQGV
jgi:hypothetical protein